MTLVILLTLAMLCLAEGLTFYVVAGKLDSAGTAQGLRDAHFNRVGSYAGLALSAMLFVVFVFIVIRGGLVARKTRTT